MDLGWKGKVIANYVHSSSRPLRNAPGNKARVVGILERDCLTINELTERIHMTRQGVRYLVNCLVKEQKLRKVGIAKFGADRYRAITQSF